MIDNSNCVDNSGLSSYRPIVDAVRIHSMSKELGSQVAGNHGGEFGCYCCLPGRMFQCSITRNPRSIGGHCSMMSNVLSVGF